MSEHTQMKGCAWIIIASGISIALILGIIAIDSSNYPKTDLPEEYKSIISQDTLKGYFDKDSVLHIEFNNKKNQIKQEIKKLIIINDTAYDSMETFCITHKK